MASWILVPCLVSLRDEFNKVNPSRDKASDGSIGDTSHSASSSDHNPDETGNTPSKDSDNIDEVHAIDVDATGPWNGRSFDSMIKELVLREKAEYESKDVFGRLQNVIWNRKIASRSWGWTWRDYTGTSPHTEHAHFSARYSAAQEADTRPWGVYEEDEMTPAQMTELKNFIRSEVAAAVTKLDTQINQVDGEVWAVNAGSSVVETRTTGAIIKDLGNGLRPRLWFAPTHPEAAAAVPQAGSPLDTLEKLPAWQARVLTLLGEVAAAAKSK